MPFPRSSGWQASAATKMLSQIGEFLRTSLNDQAALETSLSEEMAFTEQYIAIEKTGWGSACKWI